MITEEMMIAMAVTRAATRLAAGTLDGSAAAGLAAVAEVLSAGWRKLRAKC